jgi:hypothetical protein
MVLSFTFRCQGNWQQPKVPVPCSTSVINGYPGEKNLVVWIIQAYLIYFELGQATGAAVLCFVIKVFDDLWASQKT